MLYITLIVWICNKYQTRTEKRHATVPTIVCYVLTIECYGSNYCVLRFQLLSATVPTIKCYRSNYWMLRFQLLRTTVPTIECYSSNHWVLQSPRFKNFGSNRNSLNLTIRPDLQPNSNDSLCHMIDSCKIFGKVFTKHVSKLWLDQRILDVWNYCWTMQ